MGRWWVGGGCQHWIEAGFKLALLLRKKRNLPKASKSKPCVVGTGESVLVLVMCDHSLS